MPPRRSSFALVLFIALVGSAASAEEAWVPAPKGSILLEGGVVGRATSYDNIGTNPASVIGGFSPTVFRLRGDVFPLRWLGAEVDVLTDFFQVKQGNVPLQGLSARFSGRGAAALRYVSPGGFTFSGSLGYWVSAIPYVRLAMGESPRPASFVSHGPIARLTTGYLGERFQVLVGVLGSIPLGTGVVTLEPQLWLGGRFIDVGPAALWVGLSTNLLYENGAAYQGLNLRLALGLKLEWLDPKPAGARVDGAGEGGSTRLTLVATLPDGAPAVGALVTVDEEAPRALDAKGELAVEVKPGRHVVKAKLAGFRAAESSVTAEERKATPLALRFEPLTGPGSLTGVVRASATGKPVAEVTVSAGEAGSTVTGEDGTYRFEKLGPGPVQVRFEAQGFTTSEEVAQVPPEAAATLDVQLEALGKGSPATVRGLVRSRTGEALKASVTIKGSKVKVQVSPEGRFYVTVPGGTYLFIISAPGYVTQTKKVVLADGDQAILHTDLQRLSR